MRWLVVVLAVILSGCCSLPFSPESVPDTAPASGGAGERAVKLSVLAPDAPADDVPVWLFWREPTLDSNSKDALVLLGLRSADGVIEARVPANRTIHIAAGGAPWATEFELGVFRPGVQGMNHTIRVYPLTVTGNVTGVWETAAVAAFMAGTGPIDWQPHDVLPGASEASRAGFAARLAQVEATLSWENTPTAQADLGLALAHRSKELRCHLQNDADQLAVLGAHEEQFDSMDESESGFGCSNMNSALPAEALMLLGPATDKAAPLVPELPYSINYTLRFGYHEDIESLCERLSGEHKLYYMDPETGEIRKESEDDVIEIPAPAWIGALTIAGIAFVARARVNRG